MNIIIVYSNLTRSEICLPQLKYNNLLDDINKSKSESSFSFVSLGQNIFEAVVYHNYYPRLIFAILK